MKINTKTVLIIGTLSMAAVGCQKDDCLIKHYNSSVVETHSYKYAVNGEILTSNEFGPNFFERMIALAREGYEVTIFSNVPFSPNSSKETVTFTTSDADEATIGAKNMYDNGYTVTISYDKKTGIYTCIAVK